MATENEKLDALLVAVSELRVKMEYLERLEKRLDDHEKRIHTLEAGASKVHGAVAVLSALGGGVGAVLAKLFM